MTIEEAAKKAMAVREKYALLESAQTGSSWSRSEIMQGFVGDVGDLAKLVMAKEGRRKIDDVDAKLAHELADCFWSILVLANMFNVNLEESFARTMDELNLRIESELAK